MLLTSLVTSSLSNPSLPSSPSSCTPSSLYFLFSKLSLFLEGPSSKGFYWKTKKKFFNLALNCIKDKKYRFTSSVLYISPLLIVPKWLKPPVITILWWLTCLFFLEACLTIFAFISAIVGYMLC